jgi:hypothetical protein
MVLGDHPEFALACQPEDLVSEGEFQFAGFGQ